MQQMTRGVLEEAWVDVWDRGNLDALDNLVAPSYVRRSSGSEARRSLDELKAEIAAIREAFPDLRTVVEAIVLDGQSGAVFWRSEGTHLRPFLGVPPTGLRVRTTGSNHLTLADGRITAETVTWDGSELLASLGVRSLQDAARSSRDDAEGDPGPDVLKSFNRQFVTGVTVVTTRDAESRPRGLAVNSYASISIEPGLVLVCVQKTSSSYPALFATTHLGINILSARQLDVAQVFGRPGPDKFAQVDWHPGPNGSPLIADAAAALEAEIRERFQAPTHTIFVCRVRHAEVTDDDPMIYRAGGFFRSDDLQAC